MMMIKQIQFVPNESEREENQCNRPQNKSERIDPTILFHGYAIDRINCKNVLLFFYLVVISNNPVSDDVQGIR